MAASLIGGAAVGAVFGELLKAVLQIKDKAVMFKQTLVHLRSTLIAIAPIIKEIEKHNNDLGRPKEELELLIRQMEEGTILVCKCSKIHRLNYVAKVRYQEQLEALVDSLLRFFIIDMQAQTARDQKETLLKVTRILSAVNKFPFATNSGDTSQPNDENAVENSSGEEHVTQESTSSDAGHIDINVNDDEPDTPQSTATVKEATETSFAQEAMEPLSRIADGVEQTREEPLSFSSSILQRCDESFENPLAGNIGSQNVDNKILGTALYDFVAGGDDEVKRMRPGRDGKMAGLVPVLFLNHLESCTSYSTATTKNNEAGTSSSQETIEPQNSIAHEVLGQIISDEKSPTPKTKFLHIRLPKIGGFNRKAKAKSPFLVNFKRCDACNNENLSVYKMDSPYCRTCYDELFLLKGLSFNHSSYSFELEDLLRASADFLGRGTYGTSYKVTLEDSIIVAVKRLREVLLGKTEFEKQMENMQNSLPQHPNVLPLRAYYFHKYEKLLVYDYIAHGSFSRLLHDTRESFRSLDWDTRMEISLGAAMGISHIHSVSGMNFVHGNIKSSNVLVTENFEGCISDFGLTNLSKVKQYKNDGYKAPEIVETGKLTQECDVYSFGVILCEMLTGQSPANNSWEYLRVVTGGGKLAHNNVFDIDPEDLIKEEQMIRTGRLAIRCIAKMPHARPSMVEVVKRMQEIRSFNKF